MPGLTLRAGYNYGKSPIGSEDVLQNYGSIAVVEHHLSLGVTKQWSPAIATSLSYTHGFNNEVTSSINPAVSIDASQNITYLQLGFRF
jgi:long-chain fatty acid transport protein